MDLGLSDKTCLITGASTGIGRAAAIGLAAEGARVVITARSLEPLRSLQQEIRKAGGQEPVVVTADLSKSGQARQLIDDVLAKAVRIDVLVNNAGGSRPLKTFDDSEMWAEGSILNFTSAREISQFLLPAMSDRGWGRIINITGAILGRAMNAAAPAKAALESWSKAAAATYAKMGVTINCIAPGRINTVQILERLHPTEESRREFIERNIPMGRFGEPPEVAALITFLASGKASYITATTIPVDGGTMRWAF